MQGLLIAYKAENQFCTMVGIGIMAQIAWQVFCNIAVVTNTIPNTGISLPFFSSGGTSLILLLAEMGVMVNIGRNGERAAQQRAKMRAQREAERRSRAGPQDHRSGNARPAQNGKRAARPARRPGVIRRNHYACFDRCRRHCRPYQPGTCHCRCLKKADPTAEIHFAGRREGMEYGLVTQAGYPFHHIEITGFQRKLTLNNIRRNIVTLWNLALSGPKAKQS